jgi:hypothetical protein
MKKLHKGDTVYHFPSGYFGKINFILQTYLDVDVDGEEHVTIWHRYNVVEVNPDTPQNRLTIQLKYSGN